MPRAPSSQTRDRERRRSAGRTLSALPHLLMALFVLLGANRAVAQFTQYVAPGTLGTETESLEKRLEEGSSGARYRLGKLRVDPVLYVRDVGYQSNVFGATDDEDEVSDYHLLVAAGLNSYLPLGDKAMFAAFVTPQYSWWAENDDLRQLYLSLGAGVFAFFNRLTVTADVRRLEQEDLLNAEVLAPVRIDENRLSLSAEVEVRRSLFTFATWRVSEYRHSGAAATAVPELDLLELDRDLRSLRLGVRVELGSWSLGLGVEESENEFLVDPDLRSNEGTSPFAELRFAGNRVSAEATLSDTRLDFAPGSALTDFSSNTGSGRVIFETPQRFDLALYASSNIVFSARETASLFVERRLGLSLGREPGRRVSWLAFFETGELEYTGRLEEDRVDDLTALGLNLGYDLTDDITVVLAFEETDYQSSLPEFDRSVSTLGLRLAFRDSLYPF